MRMLIRVPRRRRLDVDAALVGLDDLVRDGEPDPVPSPSS